MKRMLTDRNASKDIADQYQIQRDEVFTIKDYDIALFRKLICAQFAELSKLFYFDFTDKDPYKYNTIEELKTDWRNNIIKVNTSGNDSILWGKVYNLMFRAIHDYVHCVQEYGFTYLNEVSAFKSQYEWSRDNWATKFPNLDWELFKKVLRSEIVYQAAVKENFDQFHIEQKIILVDILNHTS